MQHVPAGRRIESAGEVESCVRQTRVEAIHDHTVWPRLSADRQGVNLESCHGNLACLYLDREPRLVPSASHVDGRRGAAGRAPGWGPRRRDLREVAELCVDLSVDVRRVEIDSHVDSRRVRTGDHVGGVDPDLRTIAGDSPGEDRRSDAGVHDVAAGEHSRQRGVAERASDFQRPSDAARECYVASAQHPGGIVDCGDVDVEHSVERRSGEAIRRQRAAPARLDPCRGAQLLF